jgi:ubiquinone/menaquinone biosynthesis C-methylase UbiE
MTDVGLNKDRLSKFYGQMSSLDGILAAASASGLDPERLEARDLYVRSLDCHNLGMFTVLRVLADVATEYGTPRSDEKVLDLGCGLGGPGRFLVDQFGCSVVGVDLLPLRVEIARALTERTGLSDRISYRVADATDLESDAGSFAQVWMLDVSMHIRDKQALFSEIARVLEPGGLLVMHEQTGPLPAAMRPVVRQAPYIAPSLPQLIRYVESAGLRLMTWRDTTQLVLEYFVDMREMLGGAEGVDSKSERGGLDHGRKILDGYIQALANDGGRTGALIARRVQRSPADL